MKRSFYTPLTYASLTDKKLIEFTIYFVGRVLIEIEHYLNCSEFALHHFF